MKLRWRELAVAFLMALVLWYGVSGSEKMESQVEMRVDYRGLPQGLVVREGLVSKISVRIRAPLGLLRSQTSRDYTHLMDLSGLHKGENVLSINTSQLPIRGGVEVIDVTPYQIRLEVDSIESKTVPLTAEIKGDLPVDFVAQAVLAPSEVVVSGPSGELDSIRKISVPVVLDDQVVPGTREKQQTLSLPAGVEALPPQVTVALHLDIKRKLVKATRKVQMESQSPRNSFMRPDKVVVSVAVPESQAGKVASSKEIQAVVKLGNNAPGSYSLPVQVTLPEGSELVSVDPAHVTVTLEQQ